MRNTTLKKTLEAFGPDALISWARWAPSSSATQTLTEAHGITSIERTGSLAELIALANELRTDYTAHIADDTAHNDADATNVLTAPAATTLASAITLLNDLRTQYTAHIADDTVHDTADATNTIASAACTDRATAVTLANQLKTAYNAHRTQATVHPADDVTNVVAAVLTVTGCYKINLEQKSGAVFALLGHVENDTTHFHFENVVKTSGADRTVDVRHRSVAYASVASGPSASDTVDELCVLVIQAQNNVLRNHSKNDVLCHGPKYDLAYVRWAPSSDATQTLTEAFGVSSVTRSGAGAYTVNLASTSKALLPFISYVENDTTNYHWVDVTASSASSKTVTVRHRTHVYASVAGAPTASDTVDELEVLVLMRVAT